MTEPLATTTYARIVSRETVRITLTLASLNDFPVKVADIRNSYTMATVTEKIWTVLGPKLCENAGRSSIVVQAHYGLKSAGAAFWNHLADCMHNLGFQPCPDNLDLWMKPIVMPENIFNFYTYVLIYVDDMMVVHHDADSVLRGIYNYFKLKPSFIGDPEIYLGAKF